jgi:hypothetical protein
MISNLADWQICTQCFTYRLHYATLIPHHSVGTGPLTALNEIFGKYIYVISHLDHLLYIIQCT